MKRHSLFCAGFWPFLLWFVVITALLLALTLAFKWHPIENDVANNARQRLASNGINWVDVETFNKGRTVILMGTAPNQEDADKALSLVKTAKGVHTAKFHPTEISIAPEAPAYLNAIVTQQTIVLRGTLQDQTTVETLLKDATAVFGDGNVLNKLSIGENTAALADYSGLFSTIANQGNSAPFSASFIENGLTLNGQVINTDQKVAIGNKLAQLLNISVNNNLKVVLPPIKRDICQELVSELLVNGKINFASGKQEITTDSFELLQSIADIAKRCPKSSFEVAGHTDSTGNLEKNMSLSKARAQAVIDHLVSLKLSPTQFSAAGYGPNNPVADNDTAQGREKNRRIEFRLNNAKNDDDQSSTN